MLRVYFKNYEKEGIPVLENVALARALFHLDVADFIPADLIEPVAEVFRWVQTLKEEQGLADDEDQTELSPHRSAAQGS